MLLFGHFLLCSVALWCSSLSWKATCCLSLRGKLYVVYWGVQTCTADLHPYDGTKHDISTCYRNQWIFDWWLSVARHWQESCWREPSRGTTCDPPSGRKRIAVASTSLDDGFESGSSFTVYFRTTDIVMVSIVVEYIFEMENIMLSVRAVVHVRGLILSLHPWSGTFSGDDWTSSSGNVALEVCVEQILFKLSVRDTLG